MTTSGGLFGDNIGIIIYIAVGSFFNVNAMNEGTE